MMKHKKKGQSATEFVVLSSFMLIVFFIFFIVIQQQIVDFSHEQDRTYLKEASNQVFTELELARSTLPDYQKTFTLKSGENSYDISLLDKKELVTSFGDKEYVKFLKYNVSGQIHNPNDNTTNIVYKRDGKIKLSNGTTIYNKTLSGISLNVDPEQCYIANEANTTCLPIITSTEELSLCNESYHLCQG